MQTVRVYVCVCVCVWLSLVIKRILNAVADAGVLLQSAVVRCYHCSVPLPFSLVFATSIRLESEHRPRQWRPLGEYSPSSSNISINQKFSNRLSLFSLPFSRDVDSDNSLLLLMLPSPPTPRLHQQQTSDNQSNRKEERRKKRKTLCQTVKWLWFNQNSKRRASSNKWKKVFF